MANDLSVRRQLSRLSLSWTRLTAIRYMYATYTKKNGPTHLTEVNGTVNPKWGSAKKNLNSK